MNQCPNCTEHHDPQSVCLIAALAGVVVDRIEDDYTVAQVNSAFQAFLAEDFDLDGLWDELLGPAADRIEDGMRPHLPSAGTRPEGGRL